MSDHSNISDQRAEIVRPRTAPMADAVPAAPRMAVPQTPATDADGAQRKEEKKPTRRSYEDLPAAVRLEFKELVESRDSIKARIYSRVGNWRTAEDLTGDVFDVMIHKLMRGEHNFNHSQRQYAAGIAGNLIKKHWQRTKIDIKIDDPNSPPERVNIEVLTSDTSELHGDALDDEFQAFNEMEGIKELFQHCAQTLTPYQITVFYLHTVCEYPYEDIGFILNRDVTALRVCHNEALAKIRADAVGLADLRLATRRLDFSDNVKSKIPSYAKKKAAARKRFGSNK
ncbi:RNA polymerase sigma factor [Streptomyces virginiae]|uniref:RNA polymerase sigma factor n=1 Tax=Streptomyces virginiae TaxID=1961 RepID=UPI0005277244|nr:sigma-70 family RNA polymerase sigma factor [Streptomyces virginiae]